MLQHSQFILGGALLIVVEPYKYQANTVCTRCVMDDTAGGIIFDKGGVCSFCKIHDSLEQKYPLNDETPLKLKQQIEKIKRSGKGKQYDCVLGVSGGRDSTYTLLKAVELGLRPLAVHFDNGWNSEIAVKNIENACKKLNVDLYTHVADWEEFKDLQRSFFKASVPDVEVPTDWVIHSVLFNVANKEGLKYFVTGGSFRTEGTTPITWTYQDGKYLRSVQNAFGTIKIKSFPIVGLSELLFYLFVRQIRTFRLLYFVPYEEKEVLKLIKNQLDWSDYGGKHHESTFTSFFQSYYLTRKFNIDKRKLHYSALIRSGQLSRETALDKLRVDPFEGGKEMIDYVLKKLSFSEYEFQEIMNAQPKSFMDYGTYFSYIKLLKKPIQIAVKMDIIPEVVNQKYFNY